MFLAADITDWCFLFPLFRQPSQTEYMLTSTGKCTERKTAKLAGMQDGRQVLSETMQLIRLIIVNVVLHSLFFIFKGFDTTLFVNVEDLQ